MFIIKDEVFFLIIYLKFPFIVDIIEGKNIQIISLIGDSCVLINRKIYKNNSI